MPLALGLGTLAVIVIYVALNALYLYVLPVAELAALPGGRLLDMVGRAAVRIRRRRTCIAVFTMVSLRASISAMMLAGPRVYYAMARDGVFLPAAGTRASEVPHAGRRDHRAGAVERRARAVGHAVATGELHRLCRGAVFRRLRSRRSSCCDAASPTPPRPFRAWGYPWAPAVFVAASSAMVVNEIFRNGATALAGVAVIAAGVPVYFFFRRGKKSTDH